jgi:hypothetical protein
MRDRPLEFQLISPLLSIIEYTFDSVMAKKGNMNDVT